MGLNFNPPTPCGVGLQAGIIDLQAAQFQSTHPVWGGTLSQMLFSPSHRISIHPPRVGWDGSGAPLAASSSRFQSTHPVWGGTLGLDTFPG